MRRWPPSNYVDDFAGGRRQAPRCAARLKAVLRFHPPEGEGEGGRSEMECETRNLGETGLAISVPSNHIGGHYFSVVGSVLEIMLDLPAGPVRMLATPKWCDWSSEEDGEKSYLVGLRITEMSDEEWVLLVRYVHASVC